MPMIQRGRPLIEEMLWILYDGPNPGQHQRQLPDYCHNILCVFRKTYFKAFPSMSETVSITDPIGAKQAKTLQATKKVLRLDWRNIGRLFGIAARCIRFAQLEAGRDTEELHNCTVEETKQILAAVFGQSWVETNAVQIAAKPLDLIIAELLNQSFTPCLITGRVLQPQFDLLAYQWGSDAMTCFYEGMAEGMIKFLDQNGSLAGQSTRSGIYTFLLLTWPEIKAMLESSPKKTVSDLYEWMAPFMRLDLMAYIDIGTLRDVCAPPPGGIGLSLRPLKIRRPKSSA